MKNFIKAISLICCLSLVLTVCVACGNKADIKPNKKGYLVGTTNNISLSDSVENDAWKLEFDPETANVLVTDKKTGDIYSQIPYDYYTENRESLLKVENTFTPGEVIPDVPQEHKSIPLFSPLYITAVAISSNAVTTYYANTEVLIRGRVGSELIENGIRVTYYFDALSIAVPVDYTIDEDSFNFQVVPTDITEGDNENRILTVSVSPMFCATKNANDGSYLVVPSGSGALMNTDVRSDGKGRTFSAEIYGEDPAVEIYEKLQNNEQVNLPVFGVVSGNRATYGIVEKGAEKCTLHAQSGDPAVGYSSAYVSFRVRGYNKPVSTILAGRIRVRTHIVDYITSSEPIMVSYHSISGDNLSYNDIAKAYTNYLVNKKGMSSETEGQTVYAQLLGGFQSDELFLGLPYKETNSLTDYEDAAKIVSELAKATDGSLTVNMVGFGTTGVEIGEIGGGFKLNSTNGSNKDIKNFLAAANEAGVNTYFDFDIVRFKEGAAGLGKTAVTANNAGARQYIYNLSTKAREKEGYHFLLQRAELMDAAKKASSVADKYDLSSISFGTLGHLAYSDYYQPEYYNKEGFAAQATEIIKTIKDGGKTVAVNKANDYTAVIADVVFDAPTKSDMASVFDKDIPFYQLVFKGYVNFTNDCINIAHNEREQFLKCIETGTGLSFALSEDYSSNTIHSSADIFYGTKYADVESRMMKMISESKGYLEAVKSAKIDSHETIANGVTKTVFDNGVSVYVNYNKEATYVGNEAVAGEGFAAFTKEGTRIG